MRFLSRGLVACAALAVVLACSCSAKGPSALVLSLNTNDLAISGDTNLVGLYLKQIDETGKVLHTDAYEAKPLRDGDEIKVPFPAALVLVTGAQRTASVHARLVAYHGNTHEVLTMRESRSQVPVEGEDSRLLRLNLFFTNQGNVIDASPGAPVLPGADTMSLLDQQGAIDESAFSRFTSVCDGAPAPDGMTSDDSGRCIPLEVDLDTLPRFLEGDKLPFTDEKATCYDVDLAFQPRTDGAIVSLDKSTLAPTGDCRVALPGRFDPKYLNVALLTTEDAFPSTEPTYVKEGLALRPLAAGLAFQLDADGRTLTLPASVCALARRDVVSRVLLSQRTDAWGGVEPVCSLWSTSDDRHAFDGPPPQDRVDGGTDATLPGDLDAGADADADSEADADSDADGGEPTSSYAEYTLIRPEMADAIGRGGRMAFLDQVGSVTDAYFVEPSAFVTGGEIAVGSVLKSTSFLLGTLRAFDVAGQPRFYAQNNGAEAYLFDDGNITQVSNGNAPLMALPTGGAAIAHQLAEELEILPFTDPVTPDFGNPVYTWPTPADFNVAYGFGAFAGGVAYLPDSSQVTGVQRCEGAGCVAVDLSDIVDDGSTFVQAASLGSRAVGSYSAGNGLLQFVDYGAHVASVTRVNTYVTGLVGGGDTWFCGRYSNQPTDAIACWTTTNLDAEPLVLVDNLFKGYVSGDATYLYATYVCNQDHDKVYVARMSWAELGPASFNFTNHCLIVPGP